MCYSMWVKSMSLYWMSMVLEQGRSSSGWIWDELGCRLCQDLDENCDGSRLQGWPRAYGKKKRDVEEFQRRGRGSSPAWRPRLWEWRRRRANPNLLALTNSLLSFSFFRDNDTG
jgi:hypothetical protein